ncbi:hypothetical protein I350_08321 [Cryptococcus amylolentus CBS 6273]|uniref:L-serine ammonia-lyase n=1 Tax=Cryptococcus amylolentus CBS 6273 TaxID=1296118 RepID=A0A1E3J8Q3_9TREE|nr:hypothetical protein I350_08321 [Cryptococcus amylolentus CBS 6273]
MTIATGNVYPREIPQPWRETPLVESPALSRIAGCQIYLKLDNLQPSGSFKSRGIGNLVRSSILSSPPNAPLHFYAPSGGNAGLACVTSAHSLGYPSTIVVPTTTPQLMIDRLLTAGATQVIPHGANIYEADLYLKQELLAHDDYGVYIPPFDHPDIWEGAESVANEVVGQLGEKPDGIVCSVGGGGLMIGISQGIDKIWLKGQEPKGTKIIAVETRGADSLNQSLLHNTHLALPGITSIATSLGCVRVASRAFELATTNPNIASTLVSDKEAVDACLRFLDDERILVEPACGATLALVYSGRLGQVMDVDQNKKVVLVVCGGSNISLEMMGVFKEKFGL